MKRVARIGVLMGGRSEEKEVSFHSGRTVCDLISHCATVVPIFQSETGLLYRLPTAFLHRGKIADFAHRLAKEAIRLRWSDLRELVDLLYVALHGPYGEDGRMQGCLEVLGIPYCGSSILGSALGMDKQMQKVLLESSGTLVARHIALCLRQRKEKELSDLIRQMEKEGIAFPCIVKPNAQGSSVGVSLVAASNQLMEAVDKALQVDSTVLIEECIRGREFSAILVESTPLQWTLLGITEIESDCIFTYEQKYMPGQGDRQTPAPFSKKAQEEIVRTCQSVCRALHFSMWARIDGFLTKEGQVVITDPNTIAGTAPSSFLFDQAAYRGMSPREWFSLFFSLRGVSFMQFQPKHRRPDKKVAILLGGDSSEKEVSLDSGRYVWQMLETDKYGATPLFITASFELFILPPSLLMKHSTREIEAKLDSCTSLAWDDLPLLFDFVFLALHGGRGENGAVQGMLDTLCLPYNGSGVLSSALCYDKAQTTRFLAKKGFIVPRSSLYSLETRPDCDELLRTFVENQEKVVIKPSSDGSSHGVGIACSLSEALALCNQLLQQGQREILIEEVLDGMEVTVGVLGNHCDDIVVFPPSQTISEHAILSSEEKFLPGCGENQTPAPLPQEALLHIQREVKAVYLALGCAGYARIDGFYQTERARFVVLEVNTLPALTPATCLFHQAAEKQLRPGELLDKIIQLGTERFTQQTQREKKVHDHLASVT